MSSEEKEESQETKVKDEKEEAKADVKVEKDEAKADFKDEKEGAKADVKDEKEEAKADNKEESKPDTNDEGASKEAKDDGKGNDSKKDKKEDASAIKAKTKKDDSELTKQLQKLALDRQKQNTHDRLKVVQSDQSSHLVGAKTFQELNLPKVLLDAIFSMGFDRPSAIQEEALPRILADPPRNLIGQAQSGRYVAVLGGIWKC